MVHVPRESGHHDKSDMHDKKGEEADHGEEVDRPGGLPTAKHSRIPRKAIHHGRRHGDASQNRQRTEDEDYREIRDLLQGVISVESVWFRGQMKCSVVHKGIPPLQKNERRCGHQTPPLFGIEEHDHEKYACDDEPVNIDEVPHARNSDCVPIARCTD